jgi:Flp pilus assembly protein TadG
MRLNSLIRRNGRRGNAIVEVTLMLPFIIFLFIAVFDFGFYAYALISVENAARVSALHASSSPAAAGDPDGACTHVVEELQFMPNVGSAVSTDCTCAGTTCTSGPIRVNTERLVGLACPDAGATTQCSKVTVTYTTVKLLPLPILNPPASVIRIVEARVKPE